MMEQLLAALAGMSSLTDVTVYADKMQTTPDRAVAINIYESGTYLSQAKLADQSVQFLLRDAPDQANRLERTADRFKKAINGLTRNAPDPNPNGLPDIKNIITTAFYNFYMENDERPYVAINAIVTGKDA